MLFFVFLAVNFFSLSISRSLDLSISRSLSGWTTNFSKKYIVYCRTAHYWRRTGKYLQSIFESFWGKHNMNESGTRGKFFWKLHPCKCHAFGLFFWLATNDNVDSVISLDLFHYVYYTILFFPTVLLLCNSLPSTFWLHLHTHRLLVHVWMTATRYQLSSSFFSYCSNHQSISRTCACNFK